MSIGPATAKVQRNYNGPGARNSPGAVAMRHARRRGVVFPPYRGRRPSRAAMDGDPGSEHRWMARNTCRRAMEILIVVAHCYRKELTTLQSRAIVRALGKVLGR